METRPLVADGEEQKGADGEQGRSRGGPHTPPPTRGAGGGREGGREGGNRQPELPLADRGPCHWRCCLAQIEVPAVHCPWAPPRVSRLVLAEAPPHGWRRSNHLRHARIWPVGHKSTSFEPAAASAGVPRRCCNARVFSS
jgi:hypothetical protein